MGKSPPTVPQPVGRMAKRRNPPLRSPPGKHTVLGQTKPAMVVHPPKRPPSLQPPGQAAQRRNPVHVPRSRPEQANRPTPHIQHEPAGRWDKRTNQGSYPAPQRPVRKPHAPSSGMVVLPAQREPAPAPRTRPIQAPKPPTKTRNQRTQARTSRMGHRHRPHPHRLPSRHLNPQRMGRPLTLTTRPAKDTQNVT